jgi:hypothetical protein
LIANAFEHDLVCRNLAPARNGFGRLQSFERFFLKIKDAVTLQTVKMMVARKVRIESFGIAVSFHNIQDPHLSERKKSPVDGVERDVGKGFSYLPKNGIRAGMLPGSLEAGVNSQPLRGHPQVVLQTLLAKYGFQLGIFFALHFSKILHSVL